MPLNDAPMRYNMYTKKKLQSKVNYFYDKKYVSNQAHMNYKILILLQQLIINWHCSGISV